MTSGPVTLPTLTAGAAPTDHRGGGPALRHVATGRQETKNSSMRDTAPPVTVNR